MSLERPINPTMQAVVRNVRSQADRPLRTGWILTGIMVVLAAGWGAVAFFDGRFQPSRGVFSVIQALAIPGCAYVPAILALSVVAMRRGAIGRGLVLMAGGPAMVWVTACVIGFALVEESAHEHRKRAGRFGSAGETHRDAPIIVASSDPKSDPVEEEVTLTGTDGKERKAQVIALSGDTLTVTVNGKALVIKMGTLTAKSQERVRQRLRERQEPASQPK